MTKFTAIQKKAILAFGLFYQSRIEIWQNYSAFFLSVSLMREKFEGTREFLFQKIRALIAILLQLWITKICAHFTVALDKVSFFGE